MFGEKTARMAIEDEKTLVEVIGQAQTILKIIMENGGELTPELEQALTNVEITQMVKIDGYHHVMERLEHEADYWKEKAQYYQTIARSCDRARERIKERFKQVMIETGTTEVHGSDVRYKLTKSKPKLVVTDDLPPAYKMPVTEMVPDKERIRTDLEFGVQIPGASLEEVYSLRPYANRKDKK